MKIFKAVSNTFDVMVLADTFQEAEEKVNRRFAEIHGIDRTVKQITIVASDKDYTSLNGFDTYKVYELIQ